MKVYRILPKNSALIQEFDFPALTGEKMETVTVNVELTCHGCDNDVEVTWSRAYPKDALSGEYSEWDTPAFKIPSWDQPSGVISRADRMRAYECLLDVADEFFECYLKGK